MKPGVLYGIGVGPGAPDLLTLRAVNVLKRVDVILAAASSDNDHSLALAIVSPHLREGAAIERLDFPMTRERAVLERAWDMAAAKAVAIARKGKSAAFVTLGDPLIYSTFAYLMARVRDDAPDIPIEIVSGITSFQASAAKIGVSLCEGDEPLTIIPGVSREEDLRNLLTRPGGAAILKVYRNWKAIRSALAATGRDKTCVMASDVEREGETIVKGAPEKKPPYLTLILSGRERSGDK